MLPNARRSFLIVTLIFFVACSCGNFALAGSLIVDDWDNSGRLNFHGAWLAYSKQPAPTWEGTLHWGNLSGSTATLTFTGTSIQVFGAFKPVGTWSIQSQYVIDGGAPTTFLPSQEVHAEVYNQSFYSSGILPAGDHTLTITNLGAQLWLDYFLVNDGGGGITSSGDSRDRTSTTATTITATATVTSPAVKSTAMSSSTNTPHRSSTSTTVAETPATTTSTSTVRP